MITWQQWRKKKLQHLCDLWHWRVWKREIPENPQELGRWGEWIAGKFLRKKGFKTLLQNVKIDHLEIDWIAIDGDHLVFVEVKTRDADFMERPIVAIDWKKRRHLRQAAQLYMKSLHLDAPPSFRFDAVEVVIHTPHHHECRWTPRLQI